MFNTASINDFLKSIVPISRFNKGEANRIFDEVMSTGYKVVVKNNNPTCVLVSPNDFSDMVEQIENYHLLLEATKRMENGGGKTASTDDVLKEFNISKEELSAVEVEIE